MKPVDRVCAGPLKQEDSVSLLHPSAKPQPGAALGQWLYEMASSHAYRTKRGVE